MVNVLLCIMKLNIVAIHNFYEFDKISIVFFSYRSAKNLVSASKIRSCGVRKIMTC